MRNDRIVYSMENRDIPIELFTWVLEKISEREIYIVVFLRISSDHDEDDNEGISREEKENAQLISDGLNEKEEDEQQHDQRENIYPK